MQPIINFFRARRKLVIVFMVLVFGLFWLILSRGGENISLGPVNVKLPDFNKTQNQSNTIPSFLTTEDSSDQEFSTDPNIVITEDLSDPDEYIRNGLFGSGEIIQRKPNEEALKAAREVTNGKANTPPADDFILNSFVSEQDALAEKIKLNNRLPIYITNFLTTNKKLLTIAIYSFAYDDPQFVRLEVIGINYNNTKVSETNQDMLAFKEAFLRAKEEFNAMGVDMKKLKIKFGARSIVTKTATNWVTQLKLLD